MSTLYPATWRFLVPGSAQIQDGEKDMALVAGGSGFQSDDYTPPGTEVYDLYNVPRVVLEKYLLFPVRVDIQGLT